MKGLNFPAGSIDPKPGIYALINDTDKKVYVSNSSNILCNLLFLCYRLSRREGRLPSPLIEAFNNGMCRVKVLEYTGTDDSYVLNVCMASHISTLQERGYSLYNIIAPKTYFVTLRSVLPDGERAIKWMVMLRTKQRLTRVVLGVFNRKDEAEKWIEQYYSSPTCLEETPIRSIVYANNPATKRYYENPFMNDVLLRADLDRTLARLAAEKS